jgi:hypothetical protein
MRLHALTGVQIDIDESAVSVREDVQARARFLGSILSAYAYLLSSSRKMGFLTDRNFDHRKRCITKASTRPWLA